MTERREAWMRIIVTIISGIVFGAWKSLILVLGIINWFYTIFKGKRLGRLAEMSEIWNTQMYVFLRYLTFVTNSKPFPFTKLEKNISKFGR